MSEEIPKWYTEEDRIIITPPDIIFMDDKPVGIIATYRSLDEIRQKELYEQGAAELLKIALDTAVPIGDRLRAACEIGKLGDVLNLDAIVDWSQAL